MKRICEALVRFANSCGGKDNITAVVVEVSGIRAPVEAADVHLTMETIREIPLFYYLSYKELVKIINTTHRRDVAEGELVIREGAQGRELFIILRGEFEVERGGQRLTVLGAGRHFGEMSLFDERARSATVRARAEGTLLTIRRPEFYELLRKDSAMAVKLLWNFIQTLSSRLRDVPLMNYRSNENEEFKPPPSTTSQMLKELMRSLAEDKEPVEAECVGPPDVSVGNKVPLLIDQIQLMEKSIGEDITLPGVLAEELGIDQLLKSSALSLFDETEDTLPDAGG